MHSYYDFNMEKQQILDCDFLETLVVRAVFEDNTTYLSIVYMNIDIIGIQIGVTYTDVCSAGKTKRPFSIVTPRGDAPES